MNFNIKTVDNSILDVDQKTRTVKVVWSKMGNVDLDNDVIEKGAFSMTLKNRGPEGANLIKVLVDHNPSIKSVYGKLLEAKEVGDELQAVIKISQTTLGEDVMKMYEDGIINQHSVGFSIPKNKSEQKGEIRYIKEVMLYEGSAVLWGANPETPTLSVNKSLFEIKEDISKQLQKIIAGLRNGSYTDDNFIFLEMQEKMLLDKLAEIEKSTLPAAKAAVEPQTINDNLLKQINNFNNLFKNL